MNEYEKVIVIWHSDNHPYFLKGIKDMPVSSYCDYDNIPITPHAWIEFPKIKLWIKNKIGCDDGFRCYDNLDKAIESLRGLDIKNLEFIIVEIDDIVNVNINYTIVKKIKLVGEYKWERGRVAIAAGCKPVPLNGDVGSIPTVPNISG